MNDKVTVVISDDSDDEICAFYSITKEGVIIIDDDSSTTSTTPCSEGTSVTENKRSSRLKNKLPSTSEDKNKSTSHTSCEKTVVNRSQDRDITKTNQSPGKTELTNSCLNSLSNSDSNEDPLKSTDQNKLPSTSNGTKHTYSSTNNESNAVQSSAHREVFGEPAQKRQFTEDTDLMVTIKNNLSDDKKANLQHKRSVSPSTNRDSSDTSHKRRRTQSPPAKSNESSVLEQKSKQCSKNANSDSAVNKNSSLESNSTCKKTRTKTAPCHVSSPNKPAHTSRERNRTQSAPCNTVEKKNKNRVKQSKSHGNISGASTSTFPQTSAANNTRQALSSLSQNSNLPTDSIKNLSGFSHIIFIDLDNWGKFLSLPYALPSNVFVWGFCGGEYMQKSKLSEHFRALVREKRFFQHPKCGRAKNATDFALCMHAARLDLQLPIHIPFTVLSGDGDFSELKTQLAPSARQIHLVNPHRKDPRILHATLASIGQK